jgi:hypothetical protein
VPRLSARCHKSEVFHVQRACLFRNSFFGGRLCFWFDARCFGSGANECLYYRLMFLVDSRVQRAWGSGKICACNRYYLVSYMLQICAQGVWLGERVRPRRCVRDFVFFMCWGILCSSGTVWQAMDECTMGCSVTNPVGTGVVRPFSRRARPVVS